MPRDRTHSIDCPGCSIIADSILCAELTTLEASHREAKLRVVHQTRDLELVVDLAQRWAAPAVADRVEARERDDAGASVDGRGCRIPAKDLERGVCECGGILLHALQHFVFAAPWRTLLCMLCSQLARECEVAVVDCERARAPAFRVLKRERCCLREQPADSISVARCGCV
eukprot:904959-Rhodomonas_salina.4